MEKNGIIIFDFDDTIVNKEQVFIEAQEAMLEVLANHNSSIDIKRGFQTLREIDHELIDLHNGKHMYDYRILAQALWLHFHDKKTKKEAVKIAINKSVEDTYPDFIENAVKKHNNILKNKIPDLIEDAKKVIEELAKRYLLVLFSSGKKSVQKKILKHHNIEGFFDVLSFTERKNKRTTLKVKRLGEITFFKKYGIHPTRIIAVGDRISQDIFPAKEVGLQTIWIPGPYYPGTHEIGKPDYKLEKISELVMIL